MKGPAEYIRTMPSGVLLMLLAVATGTLAGTGAWFLKWSIGRLSRFLTSFADAEGMIWYVGILPFAGIFLTVAYQRYVVHGSLEHGTDHIRKALAAHQYAMRRGLCYQPLFASIITLSFGGSAGAEGPIATAGAAIGSNLARMCGVPPEMVRIMIGCGAGAGIAGIFKAPMGGALFTLEVLKMRLTTLSVLALVVASICGGLTCYALTGFSFDVRFLPTSFFDPHGLGWVAGLGVFCAVYSVYYNKVTGWLHTLFNGISNRWLRALCGASILGISLFLFPALYGEGYNVVTNLVNGDDMSFIHGGLFDTARPTAVQFILLALILMLLKVFATISSNSSGGVAGDFAPTIFAGAFAGLVYAWTVNYVFGADLPVALYCLFGTAGAFAGIIHAPLMSIFLVAEMVGNGYGFFLPLTVTATVSYLIVKCITPRSRYHEADHDDLDDLLATPSQAVDTPK